MVDIFKQMKEVLSRLDQTCLFQTSDPEQDLENLCIEYLKQKQYRITSPITYSYEVTSLDALISLFYYHLSQKQSGIPTVRNMTRDRGLAKRFVISRMQISGISKKAALNECAEIIKTFFDNLDDFKINTDVTFNLFGQASCSWITDKAIGIMNDKLKQKTKQAMDDQITKAMVTIEQDFDDLDLDYILNTI